MARIMYGVQGEGRGHSSRSKLIIEHLLAQGHEVKVFTSNKAYDYLTQYFTEVESILGLGFVFDGERLDLLKTIQKNIQEGTIEAGDTIRVLVKCVKDFRPHLAVTDFEPFVPYAKSFGVPFISINHQHILSHYQLEFPYPWRADYRAARTVTDNMYWFADHYYVTSFFFPPIKKTYRRRSQLVGPILRSEVLKQKPSHRGPIVVYVTTPDARKVLDLVADMRAEFVAYGFEQHRGRHGNITFKAPCTDGFLKDIASAKAVITNGGFSLMSEALYFGTPVYSVPIHHQFEQMLNGYYLQKLGYGLYDLMPSAERLGMFVDGLPYFRRNIQRDRALFFGNDQLFQALDDRIAVMIQKKGH